VLVVCIIGGIAGSGPFVQAQLTSVRSDKPAEPPKPTELTLSPAAEVRPALKYRLAPLVSELNPGDAAPIYLRIRHEIGSDAMKEIDESDSAWVELALKEFPVAKARELIDRWKGRLEQIRLATRREYCDWSYTLPEQRLDAIEILLPDVQEMRRWARLLRIKARTEIAEKKYDGAIQTIATGITFGRHIGEGPFLISALVGVAIDSMMLDRLEELISQPDAPNLYWALTALPRPLISMRRALEMEQRIPEFMVPELREVDQPHTPSGWAALLESMIYNISRVGRKLEAAKTFDANVQKQLAAGVEQMKKQYLADARVWLGKRGDQNTSQVEAMTDDEAVARYLAGMYRELRDDVFRLGYLPYGSGGELAARNTSRQDAAKTVPGALFALLQPAVQAAMQAETRLDRRVAALRVVEAIRIHAAANDGKLPDTLDEVTIVPVPIDPATSTPFEYIREGEAARLTCPLLNNTPRSNVDYRITIRK
jgi:hypothetical protein